MRRFQAISPTLLVQSLGAAIEQVQRPHPVRVALDGPGCARLEQLAAALRQHLNTRGRPTELVAAAGFYRDASLRLEYGRTDVESFYSGWLDEQALQREVLSALQDGTSPTFLPSLREASTNRSTRAQPIKVAPTATVIVIGELLLGKGLTFDLSIHAGLSRPARKRLTAPERQWTLAAFDRYDIDVDPYCAADVVVRYDDPLHPALAR